VSEKRKKEKREEGDCAREGRWTWQQLAKREKSEADVSALRAKKRRGSRVYRWGRRKGEKRGGRHRALVLTRGNKRGELVSLLSLYPSGRQERKKKKPPTPITDPRGEKRGEEEDRFLQPPPASPSHDRLREKEKKKERSETLELQLHLRPAGATKKKKRRERKGAGPCAIPTHPDGPREERKKGGSLCIWITRKKRKGREEGRINSSSSYGSPQRGKKKGGRQQEWKRIFVPISSSPLKGKRRGRRKRQRGPRSTRKQKERTEARGN